jgi:hypothetical protein
MIQLDELKKYHAMNKDSSIVGTDGYLCWQCRGIVNIKTNEHFISINYCFNEGGKWEDVFGWFSIGYRDLLNTFTTSLHFHVSCFQELAGNDFMLNWKK